MRHFAVQGAPSVETALQNGEVCDDSPQENSPKQPRSTPVSGWRSFSQHRPGRLAGTCRVAEHLPARSCDTLCAVCRLTACRSSELRDLERVGPVLSSVHQHSRTGSARFAKDRPLRTSRCSPLRSFKLCVCIVFELFALRDH